LLDGSDTTQGEYKYKYLLSFSIALRTLSLSSLDVDVSNLQFTDSEIVSEDLLLWCWCYNISLSSFNGVMAKWNWI